MSFAEYETGDFRVQLYLWIALGSALGGMARFWCTGVMARLLGETFPWGTLLVNVLGSSHNRLLRHADGS